MNLQFAPVPIEEAPADDAGDALARMLADARIRDGGALLDALEARRNELNLANSTVEGLAGLAHGHLSKVCGPGRQKSPSLETIDRIMTALGLSLVLVRDPQKVEAMRDGWKPRDAAKLRMRGALSDVAIGRARPHVIAELLAKASRPKWKATAAPEFMRAMTEKTRPVLQVARDRAVIVARLATLERISAEMIEMTEKTK